MLLVLIQVSVIHSVLQRGIDGCIMSLLCMCVGSLRYVLSVLGGWQTRHRHHLAPNRCVILRGGDGGWGEVDKRSKRPLMVLLLLLLLLRGQPIGVGAVAAPIGAAGKGEVLGQT